GGLAWFRGEAGHSAHSARRRTLGKGRRTSGVKNWQEGQARCCWRWFRANLEVRGRAPHEQERGFSNSRNLRIVYSSRAFEASCVCAVPPCPGAADQENHESPGVCTLPIRHRILFARYREGPLRVEFAAALRAWLHNQVAHGGHSARALRWRLPLPYQG